MSWVHSLEEFSVNMSKKSITQEICERHYRERGHFEPVFLDFIWKDDVICKDYEEAKEYINSLNLHREKNVAVKFYKPLTGPKDTTAMKNIQRRITETEEKLKNYDKSHSVTTFKAEYVGCPECGSKLKRDLLKKDFCPLCKADMRSKTTKETLEGYRVKIKDLEKQYIAEYKKALSKVKTGIYWLVEAETYLG